MGPSWDSLRALEPLERLAFVLRNVRLDASTMPQSARQRVASHNRLAKTDEFKALTPEQQSEVLDKLAAQLPSFPRPSTRRLRFLMGSRNKEAKYETFEMPKRRGGTRTIAVPARDLRWVQRHLLQVLTHLFPRHKCAHGFERGKGLVTHARQHARKRWVYCIDIQDFFPSIHWGRVYGMFQAKPFNCPPEIARLIANLVTYEGALPQGAPTSPILANLVCRRLDARLFKWAREHGYVYSRYADDLTFSTQREAVTEEHQAVIQRIVEEEGFVVHPDKTRLMPRCGRQVVTGLIVNQGLNVPREYIRHLRALLFNIDTFGWKSQAGRKRVVHEDAPVTRRVDDEADWKTVMERQSKRGELIRPRLSTEHPSVHSLKRQVQGQVAFVGHVRGKTDGLYLHLKAKLDFLLPRADQEAAVQRAVAEAKKEHRLIEAGQSPENLPVAEAARALSALVKKTDPSATALARLNQDLDKFAPRVLEARWLLEEGLPYDQLVKRIKHLAFALSVDPQSTAAFFRSFRREEAFKGLLHAPDRFEAGQVHPADGSGPFPLTQLIGNCEKELTRYLPLQLRNETEQFLTGWRRWVELHPEEHPWYDEVFRNEIIAPFTEKTRFDADHLERNLVRQLENANLTSHVSNVGGHAVTLHLSDSDDLPKFYTYTPAILSAVKSVIDSMLEHTCTQDVYVEVEQIWEIPDVQRTEIRVYDKGGVIAKAPQLESLLTGNTRRILLNLRGYATWMIAAPFKTGESFQFDVMRNTVHPVDSGAAGVEHRIIIPQ